MPEKAGSSVVEYKRKEIGYVRRQSDKDLISMVLLELYVAYSTCRTMLIVLFYSSFLVFIPLSPAQENSLHEG